MAKLHSGLHGPIDQYLVLLLTAPGNADAYKFNRQASYFWNRFWTSAARYWPGVSYWKVAELQQRGHVHFHVVLRGLSYIDIEKLRRLAVRSGFGSWVGVARPSDYPRGVDGAASYLSKYLLKDYQRGVDGPTFITMSRDWPVDWQSPIPSAKKGRWLTYYDLRRYKLMSVPIPRQEAPSRASTLRSHGSSRRVNPLDTDGTPTLRLSGRASPPPGLFDDEATKGADPDEVSAVAENRKPVVR